MQTQMDRLDQAGRWLDEVMRLPLGHPDRLRYLTLAERALEGPTTVGRPAATRRADGGRK
jgi:hypothetical protein